MCALPSQVAQLTLPLACKHSVSHCTTLYCTALYWLVLHCTALYCTALYCTALHCTALYCRALYCRAMYCTVLHCTFKRINKENQQTPSSLIRKLIHYVSHLSPPTTLLHCLCYMKTDLSVLVTPGLSSHCWISKLRKLSLNWADLGDMVWKQRCDSGLDPVMSWNRDILVLSNPLFQRVLVPEHSGFKLHSHKIWLFWHRPSAFFGCDAKTKNRTCSLKIIESILKYDIYK